ncbi:uncharacterized protein LOC143542346 [Bidens hawaiensis]|uniref:uncharacterized protein LOC143542346 n=1 Tax=Bidens hawaiensis TaxID=980011 RepID=UPI00404B7F2A
MIKRRWLDNCREVETLAMENCQMLLTRVGESGRVYDCNICSKQFKSSQALGSHRSSHKRMKTTNGDKIVTTTKVKSYECWVCGLEFAVGQALGGHMRRHRDVGRVEAVTEKRGLCMDLNLTPYENDLKVWSGYVKMALAI